MTKEHGPLYWETRHRLWQLRHPFQWLDARIYSDYGPGRNPKRGPRPPRPWWVRLRDRQRGRWFW